MTRLKALWLSARVALLSALLWFFLLRLAGAASAVVGVYVIAGTGWALIAAGAGLIALSELIRRGMTVA